MFYRKKQSNIWKENMVKIMNDQKEYGQMVEADALEEPAERVTCEKIVEAVQQINSGKAI